MTSDPIEEIDEEVALEVIGVTTHWDMALITSSNQSEDLDEKDDFIGEMEGIRDDFSVKNSSSHSTNGNVENMDHEDHLKRFESYRIKNEKEIQTLKEEILKLSTQVDHLSSEVVRSIKDEDKLRDELALSMRNQEELRVEVDKVRSLLVNMTMSKEKLDRMINDLMVRNDKRGLGFKNGEKTSIPNKTKYVKSLDKKEASLVQTPRKKIDLGQCSYSAQVKVALRRQPQA